MYKRIYNDKFLPCILTKNFHIYSTTCKNTSSLKKECYITFKYLTYMIIKGKETTTKRIKKFCS